MQSIFAGNLRRLRLAKGMTQEQTADQLGVSAQSVSRWENGTTAPDVLMLSDIAALYGVLVDDLFHPSPSGYANQAQRLLAVFEKSRRHEDFSAAAHEYELLLKSGAATADDWRSAGVMHEYMLAICKREALHHYDRAMEMARDTDREMYYRTKRQRNLLRIRIGEADAVVGEQRLSVAAEPDNAEEWIGLAAACCTAKRFEEGLRCCEEAIERFPLDGCLHANAGDCCRALSRYEEAFRYWEQAAALDSRYLDALFSMGFCHEELGQYDQACAVWTRIAEKLLARGLEIEAKWPAEMAEKCRERLSEKRK